MLNNAGNASPRLQRPKVVLGLATLCCALWGSAYPAIKNGYALFQIDKTDVASQLVFAGYRFLIAGLLLLVLATLWGRRLKPRGVRQGCQLVALGLAQTTLQYVFFYIGLAHVTGVKGAILNATGTFFSVLLAHAVYQNDRLTHRKAWGCAVGFVGVMVVNIGGSADLNMGFTWLGEGFVVLAALVLSAATIYGKQVSQGMDATVMTGHQLAIGGAALLALGYGSGGALGVFTWMSTALLAYMVVLSAAAFAIWATLLKHNPVGAISAYVFLIPVFGALLSALFLGENILTWHNAVALVLVCGGIWLVTTTGVANRTGH